MTPQDRFMTFLLSLIVPIAQTALCAYLSVILISYLLRCFPLKRCRQEFMRIILETHFMRLSQVKTLVSNIKTNLGGYMECNEYLKRIAEALEAQLQVQDQQTIDLFDLLEAFGLDPTEEEADLLEALQYVLSLPGFPGLPSLKMPIADFYQNFLLSRYRAADLQLKRDIAISQRGQTVAQGGIEFAGLYDTLGETTDSLLVKAGYAGKAYWLWRWLDNDQIPGWASWVISVTGLFYGSIRDATYDVAEAIGSMGASVTSAIQDQTLTVSVNCNAATSSDVCNHLQPPGQGEYVTVTNDSDWDGTNGDLPIGGDTTWIGPPTESNYKCQAANYIVDWLQAFYGSSEWNLSGSDNLITLADKFAYVLSLIPPIGPTLSGLSSIIGQTLAYLSGGSIDIFITVNEHITDRQADLICALYNAEDADSARQAFKDIMIEEGINSLALNGLDVFLTMNNIMALLFWEPSSIADLIALKEDDNCNCGSDCDGALYQPSGQTGVWGNVTSWDGVTLTGSSEAGDDCNRFNWRFADSELNPCCRTIESISIVGATHTSGFDFWTPCGEFTEDNAPSNDANNLTDECVHALLLCSNTSFTLTIVFSAEPCEPAP
jgi:hypothetical protein